MSKKPSKHQLHMPPRKHRRLLVTATWFAGLASLGLVFFLGSAVATDMSSFRSCASNNTGLFINNCGKASLNFGDVVLIGLFLLSGCMVVSFLIGAWRMSRRTVET